VPETRYLIVIFFKFQVASSFLIANTNQLKSDELTLVVVYTFFMLSFFGSVVKFGYENDFI